MTFFANVNAFTGENITSLNKVIFRFDRMEEIILSVKEAL